MGVSEYGFVTFQTVKLNTDFKTHCLCRQLWKSLLSDSKREESRRNGTVPVLLMSDLKNYCHPIFGLQITFFCTCSNQRNPLFCRWAHEPFWWFPVVVKAISENKHLDPQTITLIKPVDIGKDLYRLYISAVWCFTASHVKWPPHDVLVVQWRCTLMRSLLKYSAGK